MGSHHLEHLQTYTYEVQAPIKYTQLTHNTAIAAHPRHLHTSRHSTATTRYLSRTSLAMCGKYVRFGWVDGSWMSDTFVACWWWMHVINLLYAYISRTILAICENYAQNIHPHICFSKKKYPLCSEKIPPMSTYFSGFIDGLN